MISEIAGVRSVAGRSALVAVRNCKAQSVRNLLLQNYHDVALRRRPGSLVPVGVEPIVKLTSLSSVPPLSDGEGSVSPEEYPLTD